MKSLQNRQAAKERRDRLKAEGYCENGAKHPRPLKGTKCEDCRRVHRGTEAQREKHADAQRARREREAYQKAQELASATAYLFCTDCAAFGFHRLDCPTVGLPATVLPRAA